MAAELGVMSRRPKQRFLRIGAAVGFLAIAQLSFTTWAPSWMTGTVCDWAKAIFCFSVKPIGSSRQPRPLCFSANFARQQNGLGRRSSWNTRS